jgi:F0F1-type ATP synthase delta subunit
MIDDYTRILEAAAELEDQAAADEIVKKLVKHMQSAGHMNMLQDIARELRKIAARREAKQPHVEAASTKEASHALHEAAKEGIVAKKAHINQSLIRGWRARSDGTLLDRSAKQALVQIYKNAIT